MPYQEPRVLHLLRDHVAGVNWRPTRLAEDVPGNRVCGLCRTISKQTVLLPCSHSLCESCLRASVHKCGSVCPLDREAFSEDECGWYTYPERKKAALKAHCWNEAHGCDFVGTMAAVLRHYENECTFHAIECLRCGDGVVHKDLPAHILAGCSGSTALATAEQTSSQDSHLTVQDVRAAMGELKAVIRNPYQDQAPALQTDINHLMEQYRNDATELLKAIRLLTESADNIKRELLLIAANIPSNLAPDQQSRGDFEESTAGFSGGGATGEAMPCRLEMLLILRRLEVLAKSPLSFMGLLRENVHSEVSATITGMHPSLQIDMLHGGNAAERLSTKASLLNYTYELKIANCTGMRTVEADRLSSKRHEVAFWHRRDTYVVVGAYTRPMKSGLDLTLSLKSYGLLESSHLISRRSEVRLLHKDESKCRVLRKLKRQCRHDATCFQCSYSTKLDALTDKGFFEDGELTFELALYRESTVERQRRLRNRQSVM
ncbi:uncharacterized protein LOC144106656 [Amblyomma americanum]